MFQESEEALIEKFNEATKLKEQGNEHFKKLSTFEKDSEDYKRELEEALDSYIEVSQGFIPYKKAVSLVHSFPVGFDLKSETEKLKEDLFLNLAAVHLKLERPKRAKWHCDKIIEHDTSNTKESSFFHSP